MNYIATGLKLTVYDHLHNRIDVDRITFEYDMHINKYVFTLASKFPETDGGTQQSMRIEAIEFGDWIQKQ